VMRAAGTPISLHVQVPDQVCSFFILVEQRKKSTTPAYHNAEGYQSWITL